SLIYSALQSNHSLDSLRDESLSEKIESVIGNIEGSDELISRFSSEIPDISACKDILPANPQWRPQILMMVRRYKFYLDFNNNQDSIFGPGNESDESSTDKSDSSDFTAQ
ncbi:MAG: hypothetical protein MHMPM18_003086, partial [Marteilia pararefringens]